MLKSPWIFILTIVVLSSCRSDEGHWEQLVEFRDNGSFVVLPSDKEIDWLDLLQNESNWMPASKADTSSVGSAEQVVGKLEFYLEDTGVVVGGLLQTGNGLAFRAYLNGHHLTSRRPNEFVPDYTDPWMPANARPIYASFRLSNFLIDQYSLQNLKPGKNVLLLIFEGGIKRRLKDLEAITFSVGVNGSVTKFNSKRPYVKPDGKFTKNELPVLDISVEHPILDEPKVTAHLAMMDSGKTSISTKYIGNIGIELRGNTAQEISKKSFGINLEDTEVLANFLGMPTEKKWVLYGPYLDRTLLRNALTYTLYRQMGHYSVRFRFCELFINNEYLGIYMLTEKIEFEASRIPGHRAATNDPEADGTEGDFLLEIDRGKKDGWTSKFGHEGNGGLHYFEFEEPKMKDLNNTQIAHVKGFVEAFESAMSEEGNQTASRVFEDFIKPELFYDYIILNELSKNVDAYRLSTFLIKRGTEHGGKLEPGPVWDYNLSFGLPNYYDGYDPEGFVYNNSRTNLPFWWAVLMNNEHFSKGLQLRYLELRKTILHRDSLFTTWNGLVSQVEPAVDQNFEKWRVLSTNDFWPNYQKATSYKQACDQLNQWLTQRIEWLDEQWLVEEI